MFGDPIAEEEKYSGGVDCILVFCVSLFSSSGCHWMVRDTLLWIFLVKLIKLLYVCLNLC